MSFIVYEFFSIDDDHLLISFLETIGIFDISDIYYFYAVDGALLIFGDNLLAN